MLALVSTLHFKELQCEENCRSSKKMELRHLPSTSEESFDFLNFRQILPWSFQTLRYKTTDVSSIGIRLSQTVVIDFWNFFREIFYASHLTWMSCKTYGRLITHHPFSYITNYKMVVEILAPNFSWRSDWFFCSTSLPLTSTGWVQNFIKLFTVHL